MRMRHCTWLGVATFLLIASWAVADDVLAPDKSIPAVIDHYVGARLAEEQVAPAVRAGDATLIRRMTLDLLGRIPTVAETKAFVESTDPDKAAKLVDRLLASPGFVRHQATEFDTLLMSGTRGSLRDYLLRAFGEDRPWDQIFRELILAVETEPRQKGASEFLKQRVTDLDRMTTEVSTLFFGVNVSCARCHDHPLVPAWKQDHFYGMKAFFGRTFDNGGFVAEREYGVIKFKSKDGQDRQARMMFLTGKTVEAAAVPEPSNEEQKKEKERLEEFKKKKTPPPPPKFSARAQLIEVALQPDQQEFLARALVNRVWHRLLGYGLVMPLDQMHVENPPSHPELLIWLAGDLASHHYDLRRLMRGIVLSDAYARSSRSESHDVPRAALFAAAQIKPLTPTQLATSLKLATADPQLISATTNAEETEKRLGALEANARGLVALFPNLSENQQIGVSEALLFSNNDRLANELLAGGGDRLIGRLKELTDERAVIDTAVRTVLSRAPSGDEIEKLGEFLRQRADRPLEARRQLVWALLTCSEFRFNH